MFLFVFFPPLSSVRIISYKTPPLHPPPPHAPHLTPPQAFRVCAEARQAPRWGLVLPSSSSFTSLAAVRPSSLRFFSMALLRSRAALSSALRVHPMVREHSLMALTGSTAKNKRQQKARFNENLCVETTRFFFFLG